MRNYRSLNRRHDRQFFYKYMTAATARIALCNRKLRWSSPAIFNDPFDIHPDALPFDSAELQQALIEEISSLLRCPGDTVVHDAMLTHLLDVARQSTPQEREEMASVHAQYKPSVADPSNDSLGNLKRVWRDMVLDMRVLCVSAVNDLTAMWAHYAQQATGVVLKFEAVDGLDSVFLVARPVRYDDEPPEITNPRKWARLMILGGDNWHEDNRFFDDYEHTKTTEWQTEKEWRISSMKRPGESGLFGDYGFKERELVAVYYGWKCSEDDRSTINSLLSHGLEHVRTFDAFPNSRTRRYEFKESSRA